MARRQALKDVMFTMAKESDGAVLRLLDDVISKFCFAANTIILTDRGPRRIAEVEPGTRVQCFDFEQQEWTQSVVQKRHLNSWSGPMLRVQLGSETIEVTERHPFWVLSGLNLENRPWPHQLSRGEDEGCGVGGRWVDSHELQPGDVVLTATGVACSVSRIDPFEVTDVQVFNLTVEGHHTFAVGADGILVHNNAWCDVLGTLTRNAQGLKNLAAKEGFKERLIHAHHIVMKTVEERYKWVIGKSYDNMLLSTPLTDRRAWRAWYVSESQRLLKEYGVDLLDDLPSALLKAQAGKEKLSNLAWAINGNFSYFKNGVKTRWYDFGIHSTEYTKAVYEGLEEIVKKGARLKWSEAQTAVAIRDQLDKWRIILEEGKQFWY